MADVTKITLPDGTTKDIKDATARSQIQTVADQSTQYNYIPVKSETKTLGVVTFVANTVTGVVNVNGDNTSGTYQDYELPEVILAAGTYKMLSFSGVSAPTIVGFILKSGGTTIATEWGNEGVFTLAASTSIVPVVRAWNGANISNVNVKPFVILKSLYDAGFTSHQPYALPNVTITPALIECVDSGKKNLLELDFASQTINGVIFTNNNDGTVTITGTLNAANAPLVIGAVELPAGTYVLSGTPSGGGESTWQLDTTTPSYYQDTGSGVSITLTQTTTVTVRIRIASSGTLNLLFKPMICRKEFWDVSQKYVPYAMDNVELTAKEQANENNILSVMMSQSSTTGDLNDIAVNEFRVYTNSSTHLPSVDWCFVHTSVNPDSPTTSRLQFAVVMSTGVSYVRTMGGGEWHNWLQITNA